MKKITFECETITPMFCYGADQETPEIRAASIQGAMRFWWRALHPDMDINELRDKETKIFGGVGFSYKKDGKEIKIPSQKSRLLLQVETQGHLSTEMNENAEPKYFLFGQFNKDKSAKYIKKGNKFSLIINKNALSEDVLFTLFLTGLVGGIGSKNRNGFGKFKINCNLSKYLTRIFHKGVRIITTQIRFRMYTWTETHSRSSVLRECVCYKVNMVV